MNTFPQSRLLIWYQRVHRQLPWRMTIDPYAIWVSEIIMQQTRVDQGLPYYNRFMEKFPDVFLLASANEDDVLKAWEGLGYYSRARNMHHSAKIIAEDLAGRFPVDHKAILNLKGIGEYTAAAISSIAFGLPFACVDGNVTRVVARFFGIKQSVDIPRVRAQIKLLAQNVLDLADPGMHNQAMMELSALCCTPTSPDCSKCPLNTDCHAFQLHVQDELPVRSGRPPVRSRFFYYSIYTDGTSTVIHKRPKGDIWQGLYEFPLLETGQKLTDEAWPDPAELTGQMTVRSVSEPIRHVLTHQHIHARFATISARKLKMPGETVVSIDDLTKFAMPRLITRYLKKESFAFDRQVLNLC